MLQAADHELCQDHHSRPAHPCAAVHHDGRVAGVAAVQHAVGVPAHRLYLLQVSCKRKRQASLQTSTCLNVKFRRGGGKNVEVIVCQSGNNLHFLQHNNYLGQGALNSTASSKYQLGVNYYLGVCSFKLNSSFKKLNSVFPLANLQVP